MVHQCLTVGVLPTRLQQGANTLHSQAIIYTTGWTKRLASMSQPTYPSRGYTQPMFVYGVLPQIAPKFLLRNQGRYSFPTAVGHGFSSPRPHSVRTYLSVEMIELLRELQFHDQLISFLFRQGQPCPTSQSSAPATGAGPSPFPPTASIVADRRYSTCKFCELRPFFGRPGTIASDRA